MNLRIAEEAEDFREFTQVVLETPVRHTHRYAMPTPTEQILRAVEMSDAEEESTRFVQHIQDLQGILGETTSTEGFEATFERLKECHALAKLRFGFYEKMADVWRGAEFNLNAFLQGALQRRIDVLERVRQERARQERQSVEQNRLERLQAELAQREAERATLESQRMALQTQRAALESQQTVLQITSISELLTRLTNDAQKHALQRLLMRAECNQVYLAGYEANPIRIGRAGETEGTFGILGSMRKGIRESYSIKWYRLTAGKPSFWCNCPDHKFNSTRKNIVCKHICFLVTRVGRILDPAFFEGDKRLTVQQHAQLQEIVRNTAIFQSPTLPTLPTLPTPSPLQTTSIFMECRKPVGPEDSCPICYDGMAGTECLNCPTCANNVHRECMEVWLERNHTCVYCRSTVWSAWQT